jgi:hypothetical protein
MIAPKPHLSSRRDQVERFPRSTRVTLIAAFRSSSGIALCADSQETLTRYDDDGQPYEMRVTVQKISPMVCGKYQMAIAGSGPSGLIESFMVRADRALQDQDAVICTENNPAGIAAVHTRLEIELKNFYANDVALYPDQDKNFKLFIAASCPIADSTSYWFPKVSCCVPCGRQN